MYILLYYILCMKSNQGVVSLRN